MIKAMHGLSTMHCNVRTEIRLAREVGFDGLEILENKIERYLEQGYDAADLVPLFEKYNVRPVCINALKNVEVQEPKARDAMLAECELLSAAAEAMGCPQIQLVPFCALEHLPYEEALKLTSKNVAEIADIGKRHGVRFQLEVIAWSPIRSLSHGLQLIEEAGRDNVGMVVDFWHLYAGEGTEPEEVAALDKSMIYGVHFCDGVRHTPGTEWVETALRSYLPGEGKIPIEEWVAAVLATGFDGYWSSELLSPPHWEWDLFELAKETKDRMDRYIG